MTKGGLMNPRGSRVAWATGHLAPYLSPAGRLAAADVATRNGSDPRPATANTSHEPRGGLATAWPRSGCCCCNLLLTAVAL